MRLSRQSDPEEEPAQERPFMKYFSYFMVLAYLGFGAVLLFWDRLWDSYSPPTRYAVGGLIFVYALYRFYRTYARYNRR